MASSGLRAAVYGAYDPSPLELATLCVGAGAEARNSIGWVVFGGLGLTAVFTLFLTPVIYLGVAQLSKARTVEARALEDELAEAEGRSQPAE